MPNPKKMPRLRRKLFKTIRHVLLLNLLFDLHSGIALAQAATGCSDRQVATLHSVIESWVKLAADNTETMLSLACKAWPARPGLAITSAIFEPAGPREETRPGAGDGTKEWVTLVTDSSSHKVLAVHRGQIDVDAAVRINPASLSIDTAAYRVAPGLMAFGIRKNIGYSPNCADGGFDNFLTLFAFEQNKLRPILNDPNLKYWTIDFEGGHHPCGPKPADYLLAEGNTTLRMLKTNNNGYFDIEFASTVTVSWEKSEGTVARYPSYTAVVTARYDDSQYVVPNWFAHVSAVQDTALKMAAGASARKK